MSEQVCLRVYGIHHIQTTEAAIGCQRGVFFSTLASPSMSMAVVACLSARTYLVKSPAHFHSPSSSAFGAAMQSTLYVYMIAVNCCLCILHMYK